MHNKRRKLRYENLIYGRHFASLLFFVYGAYAVQRLVHFVKNVKALHNVFVKQFFVVLVQIFNV